MNIEHTKFILDYIDNNYGAIYNLCVNSYTSTVTFDTTIDDKCKYELRIGYNTENNIAYIEEYRNRIICFETNEEE